MNRKDRNNHILTAILAAQILLLMFLTWKYGIQRLDGDDSAEMILANLLAREGGILSHNWYYSTELRVLNTQIVMSLLFRVFNDWHLVRTLGTGILLCILVSSYLFMCRSIPEGDRLRKWAPAVLLPFSYVYLDIILYGLYYIPHISIIFTSLGLLLRRKEKDPLSTVLLCVLAFAAGMGGIRIPAVGYAPMFAAAFLIFLFDRSYMRVCLRSFLACIAAGAGYLINTLILIRRYWFMSHSYIRLTLPNIRNAFTVVKNTVGVCGGARPALSYTGICGTVGAVLFLCVVGLYLLTVKERKRVSLPLQIVILSFTASWFITAFVGVCTNNGWSNRYAMIPCMGMIPVLAVGTSLLKEDLKKTGTAAVAAMLLICSSSYVYTFVTEDKLKDVRPAYDYILNSGMTFGFSNWEVGDVLTEVSDGRIHMCKVQNYANLLRWNWLMERDYMKYAEEGPVFLLLDKERFTSTDPERGYFYGTWTEEDMTWRKQAKAAFEDENYVVWVFGSEKEFEEITGSLPH